MIIAQLDVRSFRDEERRETGRNGSRGTEDYGGLRAGVHMDRRHRALSQGSGVSLFTSAFLSITSGFGNINRRPS